MAFETIVTETRGRVGAHHAQPAEGAECAQRDADRRARRCRRRLRRRSSASAASSHRLGKGLRRRRRHQGDGRRLTFVEAFMPRLWRGARPGRRCAKADHRRGRRLLPRRRLRARHDLRLHHRRRYRPLRPARDHARHHARHGRHAAPAPRRRQGEGDGPDPHRPHDGCRRGGAGRAWSPASCRPATFSTRRCRSPRRSPASRCRPS